MRPTGKINLIGVAILLALAGGLWWLITFGPAYLDNLDARDAVAAGFSQAKLGDPPETVRDRIVAKLNDRVGWHTEIDDWGNAKRVTGLGLTKENVIVDVDDVNKTVLVQVTYEREVPLKPTAKVRKLRFKVERRGKLER